MKEEGQFKVTVKNGEKEISVEFPMEARSEVGMDSNGTGGRSIRMVAQLLEEMKKMR